MGVTVIRKPINVDRRTWWDRLCGERFVPIYSTLDDTAYHVLHLATRQNIVNEAACKCRLGTITLK